MTAGYNDFGPGGRDNDLNDGQQTHLTYLFCCHLITAHLWIIFLREVADVVVCCA